MQGIEAISARIAQIQDQMAALDAAATPLAAAASASTPSADPGAGLAFQGQLQAKLAQLGALNPEAAGGQSGLTGMNAMFGAAGLGTTFAGMAAGSGAGLPGLGSAMTSGIGSFMGGFGASAASAPQALALAQQLGLDRSALASSSIPSVAALGAPNRAASAPAVSAPAATSRVRNAAGVPTDLAAYGNGKVPRAALTELSSPGHRLWAD